MSQSRDRIERQIAIPAPVESVWTAVADPALISTWFSDSVNVDIRPGAEGTLTFLDGPDSTMSIRVQIERVDPPHLLAFCWDYPHDAEPDETNAPRVEIVLDDTGTGTGTTLVTVVESGLERLDRTAEEKQAYFDRHAEGWGFFLGRLRQQMTSTLTR